MTASHIAATDQQAGIEIGAFSRAAFWNRLGAASGIIFVVLTAIGAELASPNASDRDIWPGQSSADIARVLEENQDNMELGLAIGLVGIFFLFWFVAVIYRRIQSVEATPGGLAVVALGGGLVTASAFLIMLQTGLAMTSISTYGNDTQVARTLAALSWYEMLVLGAPMAAFVGATSVASILYRALPRWLGLLGIPLTIIMLPLPFVYFGMLLFFPWALVVAVVILVRPMPLALSGASAS